MKMDLGQFFQTTNYICVLITTKSWFCVGALIVTVRKVEIEQCG